MKHRIARRALLAMPAPVRTRPMNFASIGNGTLLHLAGAQFNIATGLNLMHVPYREAGAPGV